MHISHTDIHYDNIRCEETLENRQLVIKLNIHLHDPAIPYVNIYKIKTFSVNILNIHKF